VDTSKLRKFASFARSALIEQVGTRLKTVLAEKSLARRESPKVVAELEKKIKDLGEKRVLEMVAYTWFNRFCALRYMDVNRYTRIGVLSPAHGQFQPEILAEAKMGHIDEELVPEVTRKQVMRLLDGSDKSADPQGEAYRLLLVAVCNYYHSLMPFMFEKIADYTELLLPDNLLSGTSIPAYTREALLPINCSPEQTDESVEVIGWLYQFYIADKKDEVFDSLKKGKKITAENIPAATQLFTPHWIVRYLVENSLGRLWMLNNPDSKLVERMDYYIKPSEPETDFLKISGPDEIKVCDPACGSGHMLTYAFDLLYDIYREEQYPEPEIPSLILKNNLYGIEIDPRAGALAAFALTMKAREKDKRFFTRKPKIASRESAIQNPNICILQSNKIDPDDLSAYRDKVGRDLFSDKLQNVVNQWEEAENFGSLIRPCVADVSEVLELLRERQLDQDLFLANVHSQVLNALQQADYLSPKYHVVVANPPYMGARNTNKQLKEFLNGNFPDVKADLFSAFIARNCELGLNKAHLGFMSPMVWMFISSYQNLRELLLNHKTLSSLVQLEYSGFEGATVPICVFTIENQHKENFKGAYIKLSNFRGADNQAPKTLEAVNNPGCDWFYLASASDFRLVPGLPIAYWLSHAARLAFSKNCDLESVAPCRAGMQTGENEKFVRMWHEVNLSDSGFSEYTAQEAKASGKKWFPYNSGGAFRKWFGNNEKVVDWYLDGRNIKLDKLQKLQEGKCLPSNSKPKNEQFYFLKSITWTAISSSFFGVRSGQKGSLFDIAGASAFPSESNFELVLSYLISNVASYFISAMNPTLNVQPGNVGSLPFIVDVEQSTKRSIVEVANRCIAISKNDWDSFETSWEFSTNPLLKTELTPDASLEHRFRVSNSIWKENALELAALESKNNENHIEIYGLRRELSPVVSLDQITLGTNPVNRFETDEFDRDVLFLADTMREFISYAVGCMFGRYSLDKPGLVLANQGEAVAEYHKQIPEPTFAPDEDNVIPILEGEWFSDDISQRFKEFVKVTFGTKHYDENLEFLENALYSDNRTARNRKTIRDYFLKEFYDHHLKMYKKRPIYWLFSSPKGTFNALIYMHRYRPETVGKVLECLRDFREKLTHHAEQRQGVADSVSESKAEKTKAVKEVGVIKKQLKELEDYEKTLFEVAAKKLPIDLDDGVKHNYLLFGPILRKITGLADKSD